MQLDASGGQNNQPHTVHQRTYLSPSTTDAAAPTARGATPKFHAVLIAALRAGGNPGSSAGGSASAQPLQSLWSLQSLYPTQQAATLAAGPPPAPAPAPLGVILLAGNRFSLSGIISRKNRFNRREKSKSSRHP